MIKSNDEQCDGRLRDMLADADAPLLRCCQLKGHAGPHSSLPPAPPLQFPNTPTGPLESAPAVPIRMVTLRDAQVITAALEFCVRMNDVMHDAGLITVPIGRGELERIMRDLDAGA